MLNAGTSKPWSNQGQQKVWKVKNKKTDDGDSVSQAEVEDNVSHESSWNGLGAVRRLFAETDWRDENNTNTYRLRPKAKGTWECVRHDRHGKPAFFTMCYDNELDVVWWGLQRKFYFQPAESRWKIHWYGANDGNACGPQFTWYMANWADGSEQHVPRQRSDWKFEADWLRSEWKWEAESEYWKFPSQKSQGQQKKASVPSCPSQKTETQRTKASLPSCPSQKTETQRTKASLPSCPLQKTETPRTKDSLPSWWPRGQGLPELEVLSPEAHSSAKGASLDDQETSVGSAASDCESPERQSSDQKMYKKSAALAWLEEEPVTIAAEEREDSYSTYRYQ